MSEEEGLHTRWWVDCLSLLEELKSDPRAVAFNEPLDYFASPELSDYPLIVEQPMDLGSVEDMLRDKAFENPEHLRLHIALVFDNAILFFCGRNPVLSQQAEQLLQLLDSRWKEMMDGWEKETREITELREQLCEWHWKKTELEEKIALMQRFPFRRVKMTRPQKPLTFKEKEDLCKKIALLKEKQQMGLVKLVYPVTQHEEDLSLNFAELEDRIVWRIQVYVSECLLPPFSSFT